MHESEKRHQHQNIQLHLVQHPNVNNIQMIGDGVDVIPKFSVNEESLGLRGSCTCLFSNVGSVDDAKEECNDDCVECLTGVLSSRSANVCFILSHLVDSYVRACVVFVSATTRLLAAQKCFFLLRAFSFAIW